MFPSIGEEKQQTIQKTSRENRFNDLSDSKNEAVMP